MSRLAVVVLLLHPGAWWIAQPPAVTFATMGGEAWQHVGRVVCPQYPSGVGVAASERYVVAVARRLRRRARVVAVGESAGGTLALWLAGHGDVDAAVDVAGVADLSAWRFGGMVGGSAAVSPLFAWGRRAAPVWVAGSPADDVVPFSQSVAMAGRAGVRVHELAGGHLADSGWVRPAVGWSRRLLRRVRGRSPLGGGGSRGCPSA